MKYYTAVDMNFSFNKYLLSTYCVPGIVWDARDRSEQKKFKYVSYRERERERETGYKNLDTWIVNIFSHSVAYLLNLFLTFYFKE